MDTGWSSHAAVLAEWAQRWLVNRTDGCGRYRAGKPYRHGSLDAALLESHFRGTETLGLYTTSPEQTCRWACWDIDSHGRVGIESQTHGVALEIARRVEAAGLGPLIEDSDGRGGRHVWVVFGVPQPASVVHPWATWLVDGLGCETFPKQASLAPGGWGNFVRLPGRHHRHTHHWSRFWVDGEWLEGSEAAAWLADVVGAGSLEASDVPRGTSPSAAPGTAEGRAGDISGTFLAGVRGEGCPKPDPGDFAAALATMRRLPARYRDEYDLWVQVGMILYRVEPSEEMLLVWDRWSAVSSKYEPGACRAKWGTFTPDHPGARGPLTLGTLIRWAGGDAEVAALERLESGTPAGEVPATAVDPGERGALLATISQVVGVRIERLIQRSRDAGHEAYYAVIDGREVSLGSAADLLSYRGFQVRIFAATRRAPRISGKLWPKVVTHFGRVMEVEDIEEDTPEGTLRAALEEYLDSISLGRDDQESWDAGWPFVRGGRLCVSGSGFVGWCRRAKRPLAAPYKLLRRCGWTGERIGPMQRRYWSAPVDTESVPPSVCQSTDSGSVGDLGDHL